MRRGGGGGVRREGPVRQVPGKSAQGKPARRKPTLAIVGATGAVGTVMLDVVSTRDDVWGEIRLAASARSAGRRLRGPGQEVEAPEPSPALLYGEVLGIVVAPHYGPPNRAPPHAGPPG